MSRSSGILRRLLDWGTADEVNDGYICATSGENAGAESFLGVNGATSLKAEIVGRIPEITDASKFREARRLLQQLGGTEALKEELVFAGFVDPATNNLTLRDRPFNVFAHMAAGLLLQPGMEEEQIAMGGNYAKDFLICANRPDNDMHWDSTDPKWIPKASMAKRHRFLTTLNLHWQWFNMLVAGLVNPNDGAALKEVERMRDAATQYAKNMGWSEEVGLFVNIFGHNNVNSLFIHVVDMSELGPGFSFQSFKNCPLDAVIKVLREDAASQQVKSCGVSSLPAFRKTKLPDVPFFFAGTDGATSVKAEIVGRVPVIKDAGSYREARRLLVEELGGYATLKHELIRFGFLDEESEQLTTGNNPFNVFARVAAGVMEQPGMAEEQKRLGPYEDRFMVCCNRPENDEHWDSDDPEWLGKASMSRRHRFLTVKDLHWQWFNVLSFGLIPKSEGGVSMQEAVELLEDMRDAALLYAKNSRTWSDDVGLFFHVFGHNSVNSLHMHILDMEELGPTFRKYWYKNAPIDAVLKVLKENVQENLPGSLVTAAEAVASFASATQAATQALLDNRSMQANESVASGCNADEALTINIGGELITVARETMLLAPPESLLHLLFSTGWDSSPLTKDMHGHMFLNCPTRAAKVIIDHLRIIHQTPYDQVVRPPFVRRELMFEVQDLAFIWGVEDFVLHRSHYGYAPALPGRKYQKRPFSWSTCCRRRARFAPRAGR